MTFSPAGAQAISDGTWVLGLTDAGGGFGAAYTYNLNTTSVTVSLGDAAVNFNNNINIVDGGTLQANILNGVNVNIVDGGALATTINGQTVFTNQGDAGAYSVSVANTLTCNVQGTLDAGVTVNAGTLTCNAGTGTFTVGGAVDAGVTINTALPSGSNTIGAVNQGTSPWAVTIWNDAGTPIPISGTITATNPSVGPLDAAAPLQGTLVSWESDGGLNSPVSVGYPFPVTVAGVGIAPAFTAATTAQPALVCALSPGSPLPGGTNDIGGVHILDGSVTATFTTPTPAQFYAVTQGQLSDAAAHMQSLCVVNHDTVPLYVQLFDQTGSTVAGDAAAKFQWMVPATSSSQPGEVCIGNDVFGAAGWSFTNGVVFACSTLSHWVSFTTSNCDVNGSQYNP